MKRHRPVEAIASVTPTEAMARVLVVALFPMLEAALMRGTLYRAAVAEALAHAFPMWEAQHGRAAAVRAMEILERLGSANILTPYGRELFNREYPLVPIPTRTPPEANDNTPREGIVRRIYRFLSFF
jgi:hypothetical protein